MRETVRVHTTLISLVEFRELAIAWLERPKEIIAAVHPVTGASLDRRGISQDFGHRFGNGTEIVWDSTIPQGKVRISYRGQHATLPVDLSAGIDPPKFSPRGGFLDAGAECLTCGAKWRPEEGTALEDCVSALLPIAERHRESTGHQVRIGVQYTLAVQVEP